MESTMRHSSKTLVPEQAKLCSGIALGVRSNQKTTFDTSSESTFDTFSVNKLWQMTSN